MTLQLNPLGAEVFYQVPLQVLLLLVAVSKTSTTGGLEAFFKQTSFMGITMDSRAALALSVSWSLRTCMALHLKSIAAEKGFIKITSKITVFLWGGFATLRRVLTIVAYFIPSFGLFSILHHWQAEKIPYRIRLDYARSVSPQDPIKLYGLNETYYWSQLDRWDFSNPDKPIPPSYSTYTGLSLKQSFLVFMLITAMQFLILGIVKILTSEEFGARENYFDKFLNLIQSLSISKPYRDWDNGIHSVKEYRRRYTNTVTEMKASFLVNAIFSCLMMCPFLYTGTNVNTKFVFVNVCIFSAYSIRARHTFLENLVGTKPQEDLSYEYTNQLLIILTSCMISFSFLEIGFYFLYNKMV